MDLFIHLTIYSLYKRCYTYNSYNFFNDSAKHYNFIIFSGNFLSELINTYFWINECLIFTTVFLAVLNILQLCFIITNYFKVRHKMICWTIIYLNRHLLISCINKLQNTCANSVFWIIAKVTVFWNLTFDSGLLTHKV